MSVHEFKLRDHLTIQRTRMHKKNGGPPNGSQNNLKHGVFINRFTDEEKAERAEYEQELMDDLGGELTVAQKTLVHRAGFLEIKLRRSERATEAGHQISDAWVLSWINSERLLLVQLGLERKINEKTPDLHSYLKNKKRNRD